jgi:hypothetical protein
MSTRRQATERQRLDLAGRIELQRLKLRLQATVLAARHPWLRWAATPGWRRTALLSASVLSACAALAMGRRALTRALPAWRLAGFAARCWVVGRLGWQLARSWRVARHPPLAPADSVPFPKVTP